MILGPNGPKGSSWALYLDCGGNRGPRSEEAPPAHGNAGPFCAAQRSGSRIRGSRGPTATAAGDHSGWLLYGGSTRAVSPFAGYRGRIYNRAEYDNEIRINAEGLRGEEVGQKTERLTRLLAIGDSFVFGVGVEDTETFTAVMADQLTEIGVPAEGLNAGIPAFGVPDAVSWLARRGLALQPDVVILSIFQGNDLVDASPDREEILIVDGLLVPGQSAGGIKAWLHRHSHLYVLLKSLLEQPSLLPWRARMGLGEPWKVRVLREEFGVYRQTATTDLGPAIEATDRALEELKALGKARDFSVVAVLIPSEIQVDGERWAAGLASLSLDAEEYDPRFRRASSSICWTDTPSRLSTSVPSSRRVSPPARTSTIGSIAIGRNRDMSLQPMLLNRFWRRS